jgi:hypothetical protein
MAVCRLRALSSAVVLRDVPWTGAGGIHSQPSAPPHTDATCWLHAAGQHPLRRAACAAAVGDAADAARGGEAARVVTAGGRAGGAGGGVVPAAPSLSEAHPGLTGGALPGLRGCAGVLACGGMWWLWGAGLLLQWDGSVRRSCVVLDCAGATLLLPWSCCCGGAAGQGLLASMRPVSAPGSGGQLAHRACLMLQHRAIRELDACWLSCGSVTHTSCIAAAPAAPAAPPSPRAAA